MRSFTAVGEKAIGTNGFLLCGALTLIMAILKLTVITDWSWWRVSLPIAIFVGFNMVYIFGSSHKCMHDLCGRSACWRRPTGNGQPCSTLRKADFLSVCELNGMRA